MKLPPLLNFNATCLSTAAAVLLLCACPVSGLLGGGADRSVQFVQSSAAVVSSKCPVTAVRSSFTRSDIECAAVCAANDACQSYSFVPAFGDNCLTSALDNCSLADGAEIFFKESAPAAQPPTTTAPSAALKFMQRYLGSVNFSRTWAEYEAGFGDSNGDFWLGLSSIKSFLGAGTGTWRVEMKLWTGEDIFVEYAGFSVGDASTNYLMTYTGMADKSAQVTADAMSGNKNTQFSTMDRDNDGKSGGSCTQTYNSQGGFWFGNCGRAFPTAIFPTAANSNFGYMIWDFSSGYTSLMELRMYLRR